MLSAVELYKALLSAYGTPRWWSDDPFTVMFQAVLVQNTTWRNVEKTSSGIRMEAEYIASLPQEELEDLIRPCGFCKAKARTVGNLAGWFLSCDADAEKLKEKETGSIRKELLALKGVGEETADVIIVYAFHRPSFIVDAYTGRLLSRLGYRLGNTAAIRAFIRETMPPDAALYGYFHWLILEHCISVCRKIPLCGKCPLSGLCKNKYVQARDHLIPVLAMP